MLIDILLVEDNPDDRELTLNAFQKLGVVDRVKTFHDGIGVLDYLLDDRVGQDSDRYALKLILLDLNLPKINGLEVLEQLRADVRTQVIPIVMLTSSIRDQDRIMSYSKGINSYISKPVNFDEFMNLAKELTIYWTEINNQPLLPRSIGV
ncbi:MAG: response regulator [Candidatus Thiodiazotropha endolucinida]